MHNCFQKIMSLCCSHKVQKLWLMSDIKFFFCGFNKAYDSVFVCAVV